MYVELSNSIDRGSLVDVSVGEHHGLAGHVDLEVLQLAKLVVAANVRVVGGERHEKVDEAEDDDEGGERGEDEHYGGVLDKVFAEHLDLGGAFHLHVLSLSACKYTMPSSPV